MSTLLTPAVSPDTAATAELEHRWELRVEDFEDGHAVRTFECVDCGAVRFQ